MEEINKATTIKINVRGRTFECLKSTFDMFPGSRLANLVHAVTDIKEEYYFDRSSTLFEHIIDSYVTGSVHFPRDMCPSRFKEEMEFWGLSIDNIALCCWKSFCKADDVSQTLKELEQNAMSVAEITEGTRITFRQRIWQLIDNPKSSRFAYVWAIWMSIVICSSLLVSALESLEYFKRNATEAEVIAIDRFLELGNFANPDGRFHKVYHHGLMLADMACFFFISLEIILKFITCPTKGELLKSVTHWLECIACVSFWISVTLNLNMGKITTNAVTWVWAVTSYLTILKLVRLLRVTRHMSAFRIINMTFYSSKQEFGVFIILLSILTCLFGYSLYVAELFEDGRFTTMFRALYWAVITLTTVGYGDYTPTSTVGQIIASMCALCGLVVLAMPAGIIVSNFHNYYAQHLYVKRYVQTRGCQNK